MVNAKSKIEIGIIGAGGISSAVHLPLLSCMDNIHIKYIADVRDPQDLAKIYKTESIVIKDIHSLPDCDIALLAIPVGVREEYIHEFSKRKIPIFTEKPFAIDFETHNKFLQLSDKITCNYMRVFYNSTRQIKDIISSNTFGNLRKVSITEGGIGSGTNRGKNSYQSNPQLSGGGILMETGCHTLSQLTYLFKEISIKDANVIWEDDFDVDTKITFEILGKNSIEIDYHLTMLKPMENKSVFFFDNSKISFNHLQPNSSLFISGINSEKDFELNQETRYAETPGQAYYLKWKSFLDKISSGSEINTAEETSIQTTKLITEIYRKGGKT